MVKIIIVINIRLVVNSIFVFFMYYYMLVNSCLRHYSRTENDNVLVSRGINFIYFGVKNFLHVHVVPSLK